MKITRATPERFATLWRRCVASPPSPEAAAVYADLRDRLGGRGRSFHNLGHIDDCLQRFDEVAPRLGDRDAVEVALWFHDAIYEPGNPDNERQSAQLFLDQSAGALPQFRRRVCALILTTRRARTPRSNDCKFIDDIDLAGFGSPWEEFMRNGARLRREFSTQSDSDYYRGLSAFLSALRRRPQFFRTEYFIERYEKQARKNLDRLLAEIAKNGYAVSR
jgi:predicted metal-dependent HD superfamily phosphohydrolase